MGTTSIEWTDISQNPIYLRNPNGSHGGHWCRKKSEGCTYCYAEAINNSGYFSFASHLPYTGDPPANLYFDETIVNAWARWRFPKKRFVCSMTDLFGEWVKREWQFKIFDAAAIAPHQTIQLLTKRPDVAVTAMQEWCRSHNVQQIPRNIWMGATIENQRRADERFSAFESFSKYCQTPWISYEPALERVDFERFFRAGCRWIVLGGESGKDAQLCEPDWFINVLDLCRSWEVEAFVKQMGEAWAKSTGTSRVDRKGGDPSVWNDQLRVQSFPKAA